jgi:Cof subfamily protein (haloacid dehalogenase superfamily)
MTAFSARRGHRRPALVAIDVDGTLTTPDGKVTARTADVLDRVRADQIVLVFATGRPWAVAEAVIEDAGGADYVICSNGAMTVRLPGPEVLRDVYLDSDLPAFLVHAMRERLSGVGFAVEVDPGVKAERGFRQRLFADVRLDDDVDDVLAWVTDGAAARKVMVFHDDYDEDIAALTSAVEAVVGTRALVGHSGLAFVEVGAPGLSKAIALAEICAQLGVAQADVVAFGDDVNDIELLRWAGTGVAMGNAVAAAKEAADLVTLPNADDGVAVYLEEVLR